MLWDILGVLLKRDFDPGVCDIFQSSFFEENLKIAASVLSNYLNFKNFWLFEASISVNSIDVYYML